MKATMTDHPDKPIDLRELAPLASELALALATVSSDIALVINADGVIQRVSVCDAKLTEATSDWVGRHWGDTVTKDSRAKVDQLLEEACSAGLTRRREVNLLSLTGADIPMAYSAIRLGDGGPLIAAGRDMRAIAAIQQHFIETQQEMEQSYWARRQAESRYRLLFQVATDAVLVVDALTMQVVDANQAATDLLGLPLESLVGRDAARSFDPTSQPAFAELLTSTRTTGLPAEIRARVAGSAALVAVAATPFRADNALLLMVRARPLEPSFQQDPAQFVEQTPDAVVITDSSGNILMANPAFARWCDGSGSHQLKGRRMGAVLPGLEPHLPQLISEVQRRGLAGPLPVVLDTPAMSVEVVATMLDEGDQACIGLTLRTLRVPAQPAPCMDEELGLELARLTARLGEVKLTELVRHASQVVERHFLKVAFERANGSTEVAAKVLGLPVPVLERQLFELGLQAAEGTGGLPPPGLLN